MKRIVCIVLCLAVTALLLPSLSANAAGPVRVVKIGLKYGNDALPAVKLKNLSGAGDGYNVGYFNSEREFYTLFSTYETDIATLKNKPMWVNASEEYFDEKPATYRYSIGCYHLELNTTFDGYSDVMSAAESMTQATGVRAYPAYINSRYVLRVGEFLTTELAQNKLQDVVDKSGGLSFSIVGYSETCYTLTKTGTDVILFQFDSGGLPLGIMPESETTWFNKYLYCGGFELRRVYGNDITVINVVGMDDYLKGVIPYEVSPSWPIEAQKAQALCAKCYVCNNMGKHSSMGFDLCNTTDCQVYYGVSSATLVSDAAVDSVKNLYVTYNGEICNTYYHSSSGGWTEDSENIWGKYIPYLRAVEDIYLENVRHYSVEVTLEDISDVLKLKGYTDQNVTDYYVSRRSAVGNVTEVSFTLEDGSVLSFSGERARTVINSTSKGISVLSHRYVIYTVMGIYINQMLRTKNTTELYVIDRNGQSVPISSNYGEIACITADGVTNLSPVSLKYNVVGTGSGHNIGMSQWGAYAMGKLGFTYDQIIKFYFTDVEIAEIG